MKEQKKCQNSVLGKLHRPIKLKQCVTVLKDIAVIKLHRAALIYCAEFLAQSLQLHFREIKTAVCASVTLTMGTYSSGGAGWILLDISITALTNPVTFSYTLSFDRSRLAVGGGLIS